MSDLTADDYANTCTHTSATGVDTTPLRDPGKVWRCDHCGLRWDDQGAIDARRLRQRVEESLREALAWGMLQPHGPNCVPPFDDEDGPGVCVCAQRGVCVTYDLVRDSIGNAA